MNTNYALEVAFKNAVLKCINDLRDVYQFPELNLTIRDVQLAAFNVNFDQGEALIVVPKLDEAISPFINAYGYQFHCTYFGGKEQTILIDVATMTTKDFTIKGIDPVVHLEEENE